MNKIEELKELQAKQLEIEEELKANKEAQSKIVEELIAEGTGADEANGVLFSNDLLEIKNVCKSETKVVPEEVSAFIRKYPDAVDVMSLTFAKPVATQKSLQVLYGDDAKALTVVKDGKPTQKIIFKEEENLDDVL